MEVRVPKTTLLEVGLLTPLEVGQATPNDSPLDQVLRLLLPVGLVLQVHITFNGGLEARNSLEQTNSHKLTPFSELL
jgi:hypothetical protein